MLVPDEELQGFIQDALENPDDDTPLLVMADYLDERDDPRAAFLRVVPAVRNCPKPTEIDPRLYPWLLQSGLSGRGSESERFTSNKEKYLELFEDFGVNPLDSCSLPAPHWQGKRRSRVPNLIGIGMVRCQMETLFKSEKPPLDNLVRVNSPFREVAVAHRNTALAWRESSELLMRATLYNAFIIDRPQRDDVRPNSEWRRLYSVACRGNSVEASGSLHKGSTLPFLYRRKQNKGISPKYVNPTAFEYAVAALLFSHHNAAPSISNFVARDYTKALFQLRANHGQVHLCIVNWLRGLHSYFGLDLSELPPRPPRPPEELEARAKALPIGFRLDWLPCRQALQHSHYLKMIDGCDPTGTLVESEARLLSHRRAVADQRETERRAALAEQQNKQAQGERRAEAAALLQRLGAFTSGQKE